MSSYGEYKTKCPSQSFTAASLAQSFPDSTEAPWTLLEEWGPTSQGLSGFTVQIPEMDKIVMVVGGVYGWQNFNATPMRINEAINIGQGCGNQTCMAHTGAMEAYLEAKDLTNDWAIAKQAVNASGHQWSITGHAFGGMVGLVAALDLGYRGLSHWSHAQGTPCVFNSAAAKLYNALYQGEAGQRTVYGNDAVVNFIPESDNCTHTLQGFHIYGTNSTYGLNYDICNETGDPNCLGGNAPEDNYFYYTPIGECGNPSVVNVTLQDAVVAAEAAAYARKHHNTSIATAPVGPSGTTPPPSTGTSINAFSTAANSSSRSSSASGMNLMPSLMGLLSVAFALLA
ncbi:BZ3500_MvSof-1268-A1-R1_Chr1-3g01602 [Microbotryum saponariae]|uniref:BZ3500_MvSof-1268-A1-R1_Chr1-3g01602 protein n=1 Tax=Microbotryum saponariae TaxID=289078 RepID=A0A2X0MQD3_9BASI|nr:BZ3500_MvSof-1268-A1-R1_Chr1-3g01602 [Microbotryum saponariae]SCZ94115.1 BZ3501_MvSof-1269-A2-R1_Chr1-3g01203 [Microbotryum saponariae]